MLVSFDSYIQHISIHSSPVHGTRSSSSSSVSGPEEGSKSTDSRVPCEVCGELVPFEDFSKHSKLHTNPSTAGSSYSAKRCDECGALVRDVEWSDHQAAHQIHAEVVETELNASTAAADLALQVVEMARRAGQGLSGNRPSVTYQRGDQILACWQGGHFYPATVVSICAGGQLHVAWAVPYQGFQMKM